MLYGFFGQTYNLHSIWYLISLSCTAVTECPEVLNAARWDSQQMESPLRKTIWPVNCSSPPDQWVSSDPRRVRWTSSRSCICSYILNNEGNNNEPKSAPIRRARGQATYGEFTLHTFHEQLQDLSPSEAALFLLLFSADFALEVKLKDHSSLLQICKLCETNG